MGDENEKESVDGEKPPEDLSSTRTGIMLLLSPVIETAMKNANLDLTDADIQRRFFRALVHIAIKRLLDAGNHPGHLVAQSVEAIGHELEERQKMASDGNVPPATMSN